MSPIDDDEVFEITADDIRQSLAKIAEQMSMTVEDALRDVGSFSCHPKCHSSRGLSIDWLMDMGFGLGWHRQLDDAVAWALENDGSPDGDA